jgi:hypothetical protein
MVMIRMNIIEELATTLISMMHSAKRYANSIKLVARSRNEL